MDEHRMEMETGAGTETREVAEMRTRTKMGTGTGTRIGSWRLEERRRSSRSRTRVVDATWEAGETWVERGNHVEKKVWSTSCQPR